MAKKIIIAYIPVVHQGYRRFLEANLAHHTLYILGKDITSEYRHLQKDIRALEPSLVRQSLIGWNVLDEIKVVNKRDLAHLSKSDVDIVMPDEDVSHAIHEQFFPKKVVTFSPIFLRWDRRRTQVNQEIKPDAVISVSDLNRKLLLKAHEESLKSSNIWRQVGAVLAKNGAAVVYASNRHRPTDHTPWIDGDTRAYFNKGVGIEMSTSQHAESCAIAEAARRGVSTEGADLYVTTFPCPPCAMLVAYAGVKRVYYVEGYAMLDGERILRDHGIGIYKVDIVLPEDAVGAYVEYPEK